MPRGLICVMKAEFFLKKIKREFPDLGWSTYTHLTHGWDHDVIILDNKIVFRFPKSKEYAALLKDEIQLLPYLKRKVNAGIPEYKFIFKDKSAAGYPILAGRELSL